MKKTIFIIGGARSGKSSYAVELAKKLKEKVTFIATATAHDNEMRERIKQHKLSRPTEWKLIEEGRDINSILTKLEKSKGTVLVDCLGLLISNLLADNLTDAQIEKEVKKLTNISHKLNLVTIIVSNDVGSGIVPVNPLARRFRDVVGKTNQTIAKKADEVIFMQAGLPLKLK